MDKDTTLSPEQLRYMFATIAERETELSKLFANTSIGDLVIILSYVLAAIETQIPGAFATFQETFNIFNIGYAKLLNEYIELHPNDTRDFKFIIPDVGAKPVKNPFLTDPDVSIILPGSGSIN